MSCALNSIKINPNGDCKLKYYSIKTSFLSSNERAFNLADTIPNEQSERKTELYLSIYKALHFVILPLTKLTQNLKK